MAQPGVLLLQPNEDDDKKKAKWVNEIALEYPELFRDDVSIHPSYSGLKLPYPVICRERYRKAHIRYRTKFIEEVETMEQVAQRAIDGVRIHRVFAKGLRINTGDRDFPDPLTRNERRRLEAILSQRNSF